MENEILKIFDKVDKKDHVQVTLLSLKLYSDILSKNYDYITILKLNNDLLNLFDNNIMLYNTQKYLLNKIDNDNLKKINENLQKSKNHLIQTKQNILKLINDKIKSAHILFTNTDFDLLINSLKNVSKKTNFNINTIESRPNLSGSMLVKKLSSNNVKVKLHHDLELNDAILESDIVILGAYGVTNKGEIIAEKGTNLIVNCAKQNKVPIYFLLDSWQSDFDKRFSSKNHDIIDNSFFNGIISDLGIYKSDQHIEEVKRNYTWI